METDRLPENPYLLLTPGPLTTTKTVKAVMMRDWCTWDDDYNRIVQHIRARLTNLATDQDGYTAVLMQGSGTFSVEAAIITAVPKTGRLLILANGAYGRRIALIAERAGIPVLVHDSGETDPPDLERLGRTLTAEKDITHVAVVHCETTTGMLNPIQDIGDIVSAHKRRYIVDAMSSFGGIPIAMHEIGADFLISSANKCIQGVPGFGFVIADRAILAECQGNAGSLSLDLYDQWETMENHGGKWRFTSPTHVVRAFAQALEELAEEGGVAARYKRYVRNHKRLIQGMTALGFIPLLADKWQSPIITSFLSPTHHDYDFKEFYHRLKKQGFVIYPGKVTDRDTFRIGNIGDVFPADMEALLKAVKKSMYWI
jgi:2-aminoethylphosphonate-pyruvate transaminase